MSCRLAVLVGLVAAATADRAEDSPPLLGSIWFLLAFGLFFHFVVRFVHDLESVPDRWIPIVGLGVLGGQWSVAKLYSVLLAILVPTWRDRFFWTTLALHCIFSLQDLLPLKRRKNIKFHEEEKIGEFMGNRTGWLYLGSLLVLWALQGYICYATSHSIYEEDITSQMYSSVSDGCAKILVLGLCLWTGQKRAVTSALLVLTAICCFILYGVRGEEQLVDMFDQACNFLVAGSFWVLWLLTSETFGVGIR